MTIERLNQYRYLAREISDLTRRIRSKRKEMAGHSTVLASSPEPPYTKHCVTVTSPNTKDVIDTIAIMQRRLWRLRRQRKEVEKFINSIADSQLRQIFYLRFVDGLSWENVSIKIGGGNTVNSLQKKVYRYLKLVRQCPKNK